jgi:hypothetical protein
MVFNAPVVQGMDTLKASGMNKKRKLQKAKK